MQLNSNDVDPLAWLAYTAAIRSGAKRLILTTLMFADSSSRRENALLACERFRMAATEQGRRRDHQNDG